MTETPVKKGKVTIIGAGSVGATLAYNLSIMGNAGEIVLIDHNKEKAEAEITDILHGTSLGGSRKIYSAGYEACSDSEVVVITAGAKQMPGETRVELLSRNTGIVSEIVGSIRSTDFTGVLLIITNPVDVLTFAAWKQSGYDKAKVIGSGTVLDSSRLKNYLSGTCGISPISIHGYVLGEHGDTSFPAWSLITIGGIRLADYCPLCGKGCNIKGIVDSASDYVHRAAYQIIKAKGSTYYAIAQSVSVIINAVIKDEKRILPVSTVQENFMGIEKTAFSLPVIIGSGGAERVLNINLTVEEKELLFNSANFISSNIKEAGY